MDCLLAITKIFFFIFTLALWVVGVAAFGLSVYVLVKYDYLYDTADTYTMSYVSITILIGSALLVILGFLGCCGTWRKSKCMLYLFAAFLLIILIAEGALCFYALIERADIDKTVTRGLEKTQKQYLTDENTFKAWDTMQSELKCCGVEQGPSDWNDILGNGTVPYSCCASSVCKATKYPCDGSSDMKDKPDCAAPVGGVGAYSEGCGTRLTDTLKDNFAIIAACGLVFAFLQLLGVFSAVQIGGSVYKAPNQYA